MLLFNTESVVNLPQALQEQKDKPTTQEHVAINDKQNNKVTDSQTPHVYKSFQSLLPDHLFKRCLPLCFFFSS